MDWMLIGGSVCAGGIVIAVFILSFLGRHKIMWAVRTIGGKFMKQKQKVEEIDISEPDMDDIEVEEKPQPAPKQKAAPKDEIFCTIYISGGKGYRGVFMGEEPQFVTMPDGKLVRQDSTWVFLKTEKVALLKFNKKNIILMAFENLPEQKEKPRHEENSDIEELG
jgi:hypothetical protein